MKTIILFAIAGILVSSAATSNVYAAPKNERPEKVKEAVKETIERKIATLQGVLKGKLAKARIAGAKITANNSTSLTVTKDNSTYTVNVTSNTQLRRRFWGKAQVSEMQVGDTVNIWGTFTDANKTTINARLIRNLSIQKRFGAFFGTILSINGNSFVIKSVNRGNQTVTTDSKTKFINRRGQTISLSDLAVGARVRVRGLWDNKSNTITEVSLVKDFSLPLIVTPTPKS